MILQEGIVLRFEYPNWPASWRRIKIGWGDIPVIKFYKNLSYAKRANKYLMNGPATVDFFDGCISTKLIDGWTVIENSYCIQLGHGNYLHKVQGTSAPQVQTYSERGASIAIGRMNLKDTKTIPVFVMFKNPVQLGA